MVPELCVESEPSDDLADQIRKSAERREKRFSIYAQTDLIKRYLDREMCLGLRCVSGEFKQYGFLLERAHLLQRPFGVFDAATEDAQDSRLDGGIDQPFVLSQNVQLMDRPQVVIASLVRVVRFDDFLLGEGKPLFVFEPVYWIDEVVQQPIDGKVRLVTRRYAVAKGQRRREQIEGAPERSDDGADLGVDNGRERLFS